MEELFTALLKPIIKESLREALNEMDADRKEQEPRFITRAEVAEMLGVSLVTLHSYVNRGLLECKKIGHKTLFSEADVLKAIKSKKVYKFKHTED
jgi:excisionase family DNA binding protein